MTIPLRIAVQMDLDWPLKRHHEPFSGLQDYAKEHAPHWELLPDEFPGPWVRTRGRAPGYDAIFGRITKSAADAAERAGIPVVNLWAASPVADRVPSVVVDYQEVGRMAGEHLMSRGLMRLGGMGYHRDTATRAFFTGLKAVAREHNIHVSFQLTRFSNRRNEKNWHKFINSVNDWIDRWKTPMGIAAMYDTTSRVLATICRRRGLRIPEDVAIIGSGDEPVPCEGTEPELSSIDAGHYRQGYVAAELLDKLLQGGEIPTQRVLCPPADLVARQSTDVYAVADKTVGRAMRYIAEHCGSPIRVPDVVAHVGCARRKLEQQFREAGRNTINEEIINLRIELTKRLLVSTEDPIQHVAAKAGYGTAQHMRHVFRHKLGTTPTRFREEHRK